MSSRKSHPAGRPPKKAAIDSDTIYFYLPNDEPYGFLCQWHCSRISVPKTALDSLIAQSPNSLPITIALFKEYDHWIVFTCAEQFYMFCKALFFGDTVSCSRIYANHDPKEQKALGQRIRGFNEYKWTRVKSQVVRMVSWYKFVQNRELRERLLESGKRELAEASPQDRVWGIGFGVDDAEANRESWGENRLGKALMSVRQRLRVMQEKEKEADGQKVDWDWDGAVEGEDETCKDEYGMSLEALSLQPRGLTRYCQED